jgi:hypothetical protein
MAGENTLAYYDTATITAVKFVIVQTLEEVVLYISTLFNSLAVLYPPMGMNCKFSYDRN